MRAHAHDRGAPFSDVDFRVVLPDEGSETPRYRRRRRDETDWMREFADEPDHPVEPRLLEREPMEFRPPAAEPAPSYLGWEPPRRTYAPTYAAAVPLLIGLLAVLWMVFAPRTAPSAVAVGASQASIAAADAASQPPIATPNSAGAAAPTPAATPIPTPPPAPVLTPVPTSKPTPTPIAKPTPTPTATMKLAPTPPAAQKGSLADRRAADAQKSTLGQRTAAPPQAPPAQRPMPTPAPGLATSASPALSSLSGAAGVTNVSPPPPAPTPVVTPAPTPAASAAVTERRAETPPAAAARSTPASSAREVETAAVQNVLERYRSAFNNLSTAGVKSVWPDANSRTLNRAFDLLESQRFDFDKCAVDVFLLTNSATARCSGQAAFVPKVGNRSERVERRAWSFRLSRVNERWVITSVESR